MGYSFKSTVSETGSCNYGHPHTKETTYRDGRGKVQCMTCVVSLVEREGVMTAAHLVERIKAELGYSESTARREIVQLAELGRLVLTTKGKRWIVKIPEPQTQK